MFFATRKIAVKISPLNLAFKLLVIRPGPGLQTELHKKTKKSSNTQNKMDPVEILD